MRKDKPRFNNHFFRRLGATVVAAGLLLTMPGSAMLACAKGNDSTKESGGDTVTLRVCNWEEYIDTGDWGDDEAIELPSGTIMGKNAMVDDFETWYKETYGVNVKVEYSTFGTNEDLYNMLTLGDTYDLICPSEYMFMKLASENELVPLSKEFFDRSNPNNYYVNGLSPYISNIFDSHKISGKPWSTYAAGFMWGVTGIVYNPDKISKEEVSTWNVLKNPKYKNQLTIKDSVRECYFAAVAGLNHDKLLSNEFRNDSNYKEKLEEVMNDTSPEMIQKSQDWLQDVKNNVYSFEVDAGKADMVTGKAVANYQWSGDAVYTIDQAEEDDYKLNFCVPEEASNIYFDGWCMLKNGIGQNKEKQKAAEAFINFLSRPDNAIRNMYYIGYTSCMSGGEDPRILEYLKYKYSAAKDAKDTTDYNLTYFFTGDDQGKEDDYILHVETEQLDRQLGAQYPSPEVIHRTSIMEYFTPKQNEDINRMWVNVRCFNILKMPLWGWFFLFAGVIGLLIFSFRRIRKTRKRESVS